jgi:membrane protein required for beta-lactamase induction
MNLFALLLGLAIERLLTHLFHLREFRWLDPLFDTVFAPLSRGGKWLVLIAVLSLALALSLPVAAAAWLLDDALLQVPYFVFAIIVLLFSLGPRDLKEEVDEYAAAVDAGQPEEMRRLAKELIEHDPPEDPMEQQREVERAIYVQANNRVFGVVFWFILLGPAGAWLYRVLDLMRRRVAFRYSDEDQQWAALNAAVRNLHGLLAWIPARLLAIGYALAGSFEEAIADWRRYYDNCAPRFFDVNDDVVACAGVGAAGRATESGEVESAARVRAAMDLVIRTLWLIWCPVIAVLTLYDLVV